MSYPPPPPPGQDGPPGPGGPYPAGVPYQPNPYGGAPYGPPPKKDTTLWWVLGVIAVVIILCCVGVCGFFGWVANETSEQADSVSSSMKIPQASDTQASDAEPVSEGSQVTDNSATVRPGWRLSSSDDLIGVTMRNDGSSRDMLRVKFYFLEDGDVVGTARCSSRFLDPGETDFSPTCVDPVNISGYDEIRFSQGS